MASIELEIKFVDFNQEKEHNIPVHYIPAAVDDNVPMTNIDEFFNNYTHEENGVLKNSLRGYPLDGCRMKLPEQYQGIVWMETQRPMDENAKRSFRTKGIFTEFTYWNYDKVPSNNDALKQALEWNDYANVLHQPITLEEFEKDTTDTKASNEN